jgi:hypothetical protein
VIEKTTVKGEPAYIAYFDDNMVPCEKDAATLAKIISKTSIVWATREPKVVDKLVSPAYPVNVQKENDNHYPAGADGGKGGQFAPKDTGPDMNHDLTYLGNGRYRRTSHFDLPIREGRLRIPTVRSSETDEKGAKAFAKKWRLPIPTIEDTANSLTAGEVINNLERRIPEYDRIADSYEESRAKYAAEGNTISEANNAEWAKQHRDQADLMRKELKLLLSKRKP